MSQKALSQVLRQLPKLRNPNVLVGSAIAANKVKGVRAAVCHDATNARYARQHNGANVLSLGATLVTIPEALEVVRVWLNTPMTEARYIRRLAKIKDLEAV